MKSHHLLYPIIIVIQVTSSGFGSSQCTVAGPDKYIAMTGDIPVHYSLDKSTISEYLINKGKMTVTVSSSDVWPDPFVTVTQDSGTLDQDSVVFSVLVKDLRTNTILGTLPIPGNSLSGIVVFPCGTIVSPGNHQFHLVLLPKDPVLNSVTLARSALLFVGWPTLRITVPEYLQSYHFTVAIRITISEQICVPLSSLDASDPLFVVKVVYLGQKSRNDTSRMYSKTVYQTQARLLAQTKVTFPCDVFGIAGIYIIDVELPEQSGVVLQRSDHINVTWSDEFDVKIERGHVYPCYQGLLVAYHRPLCLSNRTDKIRMTGREKQNVSAILAPALETYVTEEVVTKPSGSFILRCHLFSEKFFEFCFSYVNVGRDGAVGTVQTKCIPAFPKSVQQSGNWGEWSAWSSCSSSCGKGYQLRHRFCDSPFPTYGGKFCEGKSVNTKRCFLGSCYQGYSPNSSSYNGYPNPSFMNDCNCGCSLSILGDEDNLTLASNLTSCTGRVHWVIDGPKELQIEINVYYIFIESPSRYDALKIHDGPHHKSELLLHSRETLKPSVLFTSSHSCYVELGSIEHISGSQYEGIFAINFKIHDSRIPVFSPQSGSPWLSGWTLVHLFILLLPLFIMTVTCVLAVWYRRKSLMVQLPLSPSPTCSLLSNSTSNHSTDVSYMTGELPTLQLRRKRKPNHKTLTYRLSTISRVSQSLPEVANPEKLNLLTNMSHLAKSSPQHYISDIQNTSQASIDTTITKPMNSNTKYPSKISGLYKKSPENTSVKSVSQCKAEKDHKNRQTLLHNLNNGAEFPSQFSLAAEPDLEFDYYDYNVDNAAVPGSFFTTDPLYFGWLPPFAPHPPEDIESDPSAFSLQEMGCMQEVQTQVTEGTCYSNKLKVTSFTEHEKTDDSKSIIFSMEDLAFVDD